jgi:GT2 family glycosyltransferase
LKDFEVVIVEDGSKITCKDVCDKYANILDLQYYYKENSGPGQSRNYGVERAKGDYVLIVDSDAVAPAGYLQAIDDELRRQPSDAWGGPDAAHDSFTDVQKAISYAMTSFFTTGGIRGGKKQLDKFYPRSFNLGIRREAYLALGGFSKTRFSKMSLYGEDIDFSIRIYKAGYSCRLFPEAWVWHKRRTDFRKFWRQVYNSGYARINLWRMYPEALKPVHALPSLFTLGVAGLVVLAPFTCGLSLVLLLLYALLILVDSSIQSKSLKVGFLAIAAVFVQLIGYGVGFLESWWTNCVRKHG